jgi:hypothetical protein
LNVRINLLESVIGGSGIFDSIMNILKKPAVSKLLTSAGKSVASALGERLVNSMMPIAAPQPDVLSQVLPPQPVALPQVLPQAMPQQPVELKN